jgi:hypothetical protein
MSTQTKTTTATKLNNQIVITLIPPKNKNTPQNQTKMTVALIASSLGRKISNLAKRKSRCK